MKRATYILLLVAITSSCYGQVVERHIYPYDDRREFVYELFTDNDDFDWSTGNVLLIPAGDPNEVPVYDANGNPTWYDNFWFNPNTETLYVPILDTNSIDANDIDVNNLTIGTLTASRIVATDGSKKLVSISDFTLWVGGTSNRITVSNDGDGTITITTPQDTHTAASPTFAGMTIVNAITEFSTDGTLADNSDSAVPTEKAVKTYVDASATPPGGSNTQVQYNDNGSFGGDAEMVYDDSSNVLNVYQLTADEVKLEGQLDVLLLHTGDKLLLEAGGNLMLETFSLEDAIVHMDADGFLTLDSDLKWDPTGNTLSINGTVKSGDGGTTNYTEIETDGTIEFLGDATVWNDINVGAAMLSLPAAGNPDEDEYVDEGGSDTGVSTWAYAIGEKSSGSLEIPHDYKEGSDIYFHIHYQGITAPGGGTDNIKWQLEYTVGQDGETLDATTTITKEEAYTTQYSFTNHDFAAITGTNFNIGDQFLFTIERIAASADDYAGDCLVSTVGLHYECDTAGSRQITTK